jgi:trehalose 6-phosphate phosphatase
VPSKPNVFDAWPQIARRVLSARHILLFLDFDGSLVPLQDHPDRAVLGHSGRQILARLARHPKITMVVISGRQRADVQRRVNVDGALYLGLHGWESHNSAPHKKSVRTRLRPVLRALTEHLKDESGVWIEDKQAAVVVHYRNAPLRAVQRARQRVRETLRDFQPDIHCQRGKGVWEILPISNQGKSAAVQKLVESCSHATECIYIGDDHSDEMAFAALPKGLTMRVGPAHRTRARFLLRDPDEVLRFLLALDKTLSRTKGKE